MAESGGARPTDVGGPPARPPTIRPPTMRDVAEAAGVSKALVSMIFRNAPGPSAQSRAHVLAVAERIGYRPNRTASLLARRRNKHLGVTVILRNAFQAELAEDVQAAAGEMGYEIVLSAVTRSHGERRAIETLLEFRCEALLLIGTELPVADLAALAAQVPVVVVGRRVRHRDLAVVRADDIRGMRDVVDHLAGLGHRRIAYVEAGEGTIAADRRRGYESAMRDRGLAGHIQTITGGATEEDGIRAGELLLSHADPPTAVAAYNDHCALGILDRLSRAGVDIPGRVALVGYDDTPIAQLSHISLTTVRQEARQQARLAVDAAVERLETPEANPREALLPPRLMIRGTTTRAPAPDRR